MQDWEIDSWRAQTNLCVPRTQEKGAITPQETDPDLSMRVQEPLADTWVVVACCRAGALRAAVCAWDLLKEVAIIYITSTIVWSQVKQQGGNTALAINRKLD